MRGLILFAFVVATAFAMSPSEAQTYDPKFPVCKRVNSDAGGVLCYYGSMAECLGDVHGMSAECMPNPFYKGGTEPSSPTGTARRPGGAVR